MKTTARIFKRFSPVDNKEDLGAKYMTLNCAKSRERFCINVSMVSFDCSRIVQDCAGWLFNRRLCSKVVWKRNFPAQLPLGPQVSCIDGLVSCQSKVYSKLLEYFMTEYWLWEPVSKNDFSYSNQLLKIDQEKCFNPLCLEVLRK